MRSLRLKGSFGDHTCKVKFLRETILTQNSRQLKHKKKQADNLKKKLQESYIHTCFLNFPVRNLYVRGSTHTLFSLIRSSTPDFH